jgi:hypothetical protein
MAPKWQAKDDYFETMAARDFPGAASRAILWCAISP